MVRFDIDILWLWLISALASLAMIGGKLGLMLFGPAAESPPDDPVLAAHWRRKRAWLAISELSAVPAFATAAVAATKYWHLPVVACVVISMALGGLGFAMFLHGVQILTRRQLKLEEGSK